MRIFDTTKKILLMLAMIGCFALIFVDESGIAVTLPSIATTFALTTNDMHWIINIYLLTMSVLLLLAGKLSDHFGERPIFLSGILIFILGSAICGFSHNNMWLIIGRFIQGIGACLLCPSIGVIVKSHFPAEHFGKAYGLIVGCSNLFYVLGPFIGGLLTQYLSWRWFFLINLPIGLMCLACGLYSINKHSGSGRPISDIGGLFTFILGITTLIFALMQANDWGWKNHWVIASLAVSVIALYLFGKLEKNAQLPLLHMSLFKIKKFTTGNLILLISSINLTLIVFIALWLQKQLHFTPTQVGLALLPATAAFIFMPTVTGRWYDRSGANAPILLGTSMVLFALLWFAGFAPLDNYAWLVLALFVFGFGIPLIIPSSIMMIMSSVPHEEIGMAAGTYSTLRQLGLSLGIALFSAAGSFESGLILFSILAAINVLLGIYNFLIKF